MSFQKLHALYCMCGPLEIIFVKGVGYTPMSLPSPLPRHANNSLPGHWPGGGRLLHGAAFASWSESVDVCVGLSPSPPPVPATCARPSVNKRHHDYCRCATRLKLYRITSPTRFLFFRSCFGCSRAFPFLYRFQSRRVRIYWGLEWKCINCAPRSGAEPAP